MDSNASPIVEQLKKRIEQLESENLRHLRKISSLKSDYHNLEDELQSADSEVRGLRAENDDDKDAYIDELEAGIDCLKEENGKLFGRIGSLSDKVETLEGQAELKDEKIEMLEKQAKAQDAEMDKLTQKLAQSGIEDKEEHSAEVVCPRWKAGNCRRRHNCPLGAHPPELARTVRQTMSDADMTNT